MAGRKTKTARKTKGQYIESGMVVRGFYRINIVEEGGRIVGDSDWQENRITDPGFRNYLGVPLLGGAALPVALMVLGTGTSPGAADTVLPGEIAHNSNSRVAVVTSVMNSTQVRFVASFQSVSSFISTAVTIQNVGLIHNTTSGGTLFSGNTYATSALATNQDVNATYLINFSSVNT